MNLRFCFGEVEVFVFVCAIGVALLKFCLSCVDCINFVLILIVYFMYGMIEG